VPGAVFKIEQRRASLTATIATMDSPPLAVAAMRPGLPSDDVGERWARWTAQGHVHDREVRERFRRLGILAAALALVGIAALVGLA